MTKIYFLLFFVLISVLAIAQVRNSPFNFKADTAGATGFLFAGDSSKPVFNVEYNRILDSAYSLNNEYEFQFRLWKRHLSSSFDDVFVLTLKDKKWTARYFNLRISGKNTSQFSERPVKQLYVNQLWEMLLKNNLLSLPDQSVLEDKMVSYEIDTANLQYPTIKSLDVMDGTLYCFELLSPDGKRYYSHGNPLRYLKEYSNIRELYNAALIVMLIEKFLEQSL